MKRESYIKLLVAGIFAVAMAFLESAVVIYLRKIYYPAGFRLFPLAQIEPSILMVEMIREFFTIVMLASVAYLAGKKIHEKFAYLLYLFAVWDIFYYVWLKIIINWPASFFTWDVLFLIPLTWVSPVLAPILLALIMIILALSIIRLEDSGYNVKIKFKEIVLLVLGSLIILYTFTIKYLEIIARNPEQAYSFIPSSFNWVIFALGEILIIAAIILFYVRTIKTKISKTKV